MGENQPQARQIEIGGKLVDRIRYGDEREDWGADRGPCHDCGVAKGSCTSLAAMSSAVQFAAVS